MGLGFFWAWGWLAMIGVIILLGLFLLPWFFILLSLQALLENVSPANRRMSPGMVWLNFIPIFHLGWFVYTVLKVRESVEAEFRARQWYVGGDMGHNLGLTAGVLWLASFAIGWIPFLGWVLPLAGIVCWIMYWLKMSDLKRRLDAGPLWSRGQYGALYPPDQARAYPPYVDEYPPYANEYPPYAPYWEQDVEVEESGESTPAGPDERERYAHCRECGARFDPGDRFCRSCGSEL